LNASPAFERTTDFVVGGLSNFADGVLRRCGPV
jgi:hypothetical protein